MELGDGGVGVGGGWGGLTLTTLLLMPPRPEKSHLLSPSLPGGLSSSFQVVQLVLISEDPLQVHPVSWSQWTQWTHWPQWDL